MFDHLSHVDVPAVTTALRRFASDNQCAEMERERDAPEASPALPRRRIRTAALTVPRHHKRVRTSRRCGRVILMRL